MQVAEAKETVISLDELQKHLEENKGIVLWVDRGRLKFLKGPFKKAVDGNRYTYGWVTPFFYRGEDSPNLMDIHSTEDLINFIRDHIKIPSESFYWFPDELELLQWISTNAEQLSVSLLSY